MESTLAHVGAPAFRRVVRKGPHLKTCVRCFDRKPAYVVGTDDICNACRASTVLAFHSDH